MTFNSYSQNLEDVILWRALKEISKGFYIDAGAYDPNIDSVTKAFYERGWTGINIEPVKEHFEKFLDARPQDVNLQYLLSNTESEIDFYVMLNGGLSTAVHSIFAQHEGSGFSFEKIKKNIQTLSSVIDQFGSEREIHFLKIDVEGYELEVIKGLDLQKHRPWILVIESTYPLSQEHNYLLWEDLILTKNYAHVYSDGLNRFYLANEHIKLRDRFTFPPNIFDEYFQHGGYASNKIDNLQQSLRAAQVSVSQLESEIRTVKNSKSWKLAQALSRTYHLLRKGKYGVKILKGDMRSIIYSHRWQKFDSLRLENLVPPEIFSLGYSERPSSRLDWKSEIISEKRFKEKNFFLWMNFLRDNPRLHSKQFQNYAIMEAANCIIDSGKIDVKAMGFGIGTEPIPAGLAKLGFHVLATDYLDGEIATEWKNTDQLVSSPEDLNVRGILTENEFKSKVRFANMDMNQIPENLNAQFDFVWSSCALGHIGSYQKGLDFILRSVELLAPGGIALHTTELDVSPGKSRFESPTLNLYREEDLYSLIDTLQSRGYLVDHFQNTSRWNAESEKFVDREPWGDRPHLRIQVFGREILSLALRIQKPA